MIGFDARLGVICLLTGAPVQVGRNNQKERKLCLSGGREKEDGGRSAVSSNTGSLQQGKYYVSGRGREAFGLNRAVRTYKKK